MEELSDVAAIAKYAARPKVAELISQFKRCGQHGDHVGRIEIAEDTRLCVWDGQSEDGKKHGEAMDADQAPFPFEGASDVRPHFHADGTINENVAVLQAAFWRALLKAQAIEPGDTADSSTATTFLDWLVHGPLLRSLINEVELSAQYVETFGAAMLHVGWDREVGRRLGTVTMQELLAATGAPQGSGDPTQNASEAQQVAALLPDLILDEALEDQAAAAVQYLFDIYLRQNLPPGLTEDDVLALSGTRARAAVRSLRKEGKAELPLPYLARNQATIAALKPYRDYLLPTEMMDVQEAPVAFVRRMMTEVELRKRVLTDGWNAEWVDKAVDTAGKYSVWTTESDYLVNAKFQWDAADTKEWWVEVVYAFYRSVDEDGVVTCNYTVFSPHVDCGTVENGETEEESGAAKWGQVDWECGAHGPKYPLVLMMREVLDRSWTASRGLGEILATTQNIEKTMWDGVVDLSSVAIFPPVNVYAGAQEQRYRFGPAVQNRVQPGREPKFMEVPGNGSLIGDKLIQEIEARVARYAGRFHERVPPQVVQLLQEPKAKRFLAGWSQALEMAYQMTLSYAPEQIQRVTGSPPQVDPEWNYTLSFDVAQLDPDLMTAKLEAFSKLLPEDGAGVMDVAGLVRLKANMIDPAMARVLVTDRGSATQRMFKEVADNVLGAYAGNEPLFKDASDDPGAPAKAGFLQQILQRNPRYMGALADEALLAVFGPGQAQQLAAGMAQMGLQRQPDPLFSAHVAKYAENLAMGVKQQQNKQVGRLGVQPG